MRTLASSASRSVTVPSGSRRTSAVRPPSAARPSPQRTAPVPSGRASSSRTAAATTSSEVTGVGQEPWAEIGTAAHASRRAPAPGPGCAPPGRAGRAGRRVDGPSPGDRQHFGQVSSGSSEGLMLNEPGVGPARRSELRERVAPTLGRVAPELVIMVAGRGDPRRPDTRRRRPGPGVLRDRAVVVEPSLVRRPRGPAPPRSASSSRSRAAGPRTRGPAARRRTSCSAGRAARWCGST